MKKPKRKKLNVHLLT